MPSFRSARVVRHTPEQMFDLVADCDKYPEFPPFCVGMKTRPRPPDANGHPVILAEMQVGYKAIRETFTTQVLLKPEERTIDVKYIDGPFKYLSNIWSFEPASDGCFVRFFIDYEFKSRILAALMGTMFDRAFRMFAEAFEKRADAVYGTSA